ncbi:hypothetical protein LUZ60_005945 [Juncus effusus]|nr:hypothetical protein LUZ60_005945 [Juncus effusus]
MREIMVAQAASCDLKELVAKFIPESIVKENREGHFKHLPASERVHPQAKFIPESIGKEIKKATSSIFLLHNVFVRKVKILKAPKFDLETHGGNVLNGFRVHGDYMDDLGTKIERPAEDVAMETEATEVVGD